jgi:hypothetical protein
MRVYLCQPIVLVKKRRRKAVEQKKSKKGVEQRVEVVVKLNDQTQEMKL